MPINFKISNSSIVSTNLILNLDASNTTSYPGTGTVWTDLSGNGNNFNIVATAYNSTGVKYMDFNGSYGIAKRSSDITLTDANGVTYMLWTRIKYPTIADFRTLTRGFSAQHHVLINISTTNLGMYDNATYGGFLTSGYDVANLPGYGTTTWACMYFRYQSSSPYYQMSYNDTPGTIRGSITDSKSRYVNGFSCIGGYHNTNTTPSDASQYWGDIAQLVVYNKFLTDAECTQNFNATRARFGL